MTIRDSSLEAFEDIQDGLTNRQQEVFDVFAKSPTPLCDAQIAEILRWPINCVTPRRGELVKKNWLIDCGRKQIPNKKVAPHFHKANPAKCKFREMLF